LLDPELLTGPAQPDVRRQLQALVTRANPSRVHAALVESIECLYLNPPLFQTTALIHETYIAVNDAPPVHPGGEDLRLQLNKNFDRAIFSGWRRLHPS
jgi:hypothetical protein